MKKFLVAGVALLGWGSALAAPVTPDPAELPGGLSGKNVIHDSNSTFNGQTVTNALGNINTAVTDAQATANAAIPLAQKGVASGVAALDANSEVTNTVNTSTVKVNSNAILASGAIITLKSSDNTQANQQQTINTSIWDLIYSDPMIHITGSTGTGNQFIHGSQIINNNIYAGILSEHTVPKTTSSDYTVVASTPSVTINSGWNDAYLAQGTTMFGGHASFDSSHLIVTGAPGSYGQDGCILDIEMSNTPWSSNRCGSGVHDGIAQFVKASNTPPRYRVGSEIKDENGVTHTLSFTSTAAIATPALPDSLAGIWHPSGNGYWAVTNLQESSTPDYDPVDNTQSGGARPIPNLYSGYITGYYNGTDASGNTTTTFSVPGGWHSINDSNTDTSTTLTPDPSSDGIDTTWYPQFKKPVLIIGTYSVGFAQNWRCYVDRPDPSSFDYTTYASSSDSPMTGCQGVELDMGASGGVTSGLTTFRGFSALLSLPDGVLPAGNAAGLIAGGPWAIGVQTDLHKEGYDFEGSVLNAGGRLGPADTIGTTKEMAEFRQSIKASVDTSSDMIHMRVVQSVDSSGADGTAGSHTYQDNALHIGSWYGGDTFAQTALGTYMGDIVINPEWSKGGIALCGQENSFSTSGDACVTVSTAGALKVGNTTELYGNTTLYGGNSLYFHDAKNTILDAIYDDTINGLTANRLHVSGNLSIAGALIIPFGTPSSSTASCTAGQLEMDATYLYSCVATNTWRRTTNGATW